MAKQENTPDALAQVTIESVKYTLTADRIKKVLEKDKDGSFGHLTEHAETGITFTGEYDFGGNVERAIELFGADVIYSYFRQGAGLLIGARVRDWLQAGKNPEEIQTLLNAYKIGLKTPKVKTDPKQALFNKLAGLSPAEREAEIAALLQQLDAIAG